MSNAELRVQNDEGGIIEFNYNSCLPAAAGI